MSIAVRLSWELIHSLSTAETVDTASHICKQCCNGLPISSNIHLITKEISIGDYVLTGGEVAAAILSDSIIRLIPGVLSDETSALTDSFQDDLLSPPIYTRPANYKGWEVPKILLSGNEKLINEWREKESIRRTKEKRPDLLK